MDTVSLVETPSKAEKSRAKVYANPDLCTGCGLCMVACSVRLFGEAAPRKSAIQVKRDLFEQFEIQFICRHCEEPLCVQACFMGITTKDEASGTVCNRPEDCVGCWSCLMVCPYNAIRQVYLDTLGRKVAVKCDGCPEREIPACVVVCPTQALIYK
ncbi:MAG: 4Fe-4S dicluster domain-containing protein [bacterium]